ncbi:unnamed protein product, partial [Brassica rapa subsp. narinosa]
RQLAIILYALNYGGDFDNAGAMISVGEGTLFKFLSMWIGGPEVPEANSSSLRLPVVALSPVARCRRVYSHAHDYHINSISNNRYILPLYMFFS